MAVEKKGVRVLGASTKEERRREADFKSQVKKIFPTIVQIDFVYTQIALKGKITPKLKEEGCFGYHMRESILVDGKPIKIAWLPHIKDMSPTYIEIIVERLIEGVAEVVDAECDDTDNISADWG